MINFIGSAPRREFPGCSVTPPIATSDRVFRSAERAGRQLNGRRGSKLPKNQAGAASKGLDDHETVNIETPAFLTRNLVLQRTDAEFEEKVK
jgi:hypothetical protein